MTQKGVLIAKNETLQLISITRLVFMKVDRDVKLEWIKNHREPEIDRSGAPDEAYWQYETAASLLTWNQHNSIFKAWCNVFFFFQWGWVEGVRHWVKQGDQGLTKWNTTAIGLDGSWIQKLWYYLSWPRQIEQAALRHRDRDIHRV
jgi:hypothetical protein